RHVPRLADLDGKRETDQLGVERFQAGGFGIEGDQIGRLQGAGQSLELLFRAHRLDRERSARRSAALAGILLQPGRKTETAEQLDHAIAIRLRALERGETGSKLDRIVERDQFTRESKLIEPGPEVVANLATDVVGVLDHAVEVAVVLEPPGRRIQPELVLTG